MADRPVFHVQQAMFFFGKGNSAPDNSNLGLPMPMPMSDVDEIVHPEEVTGDDDCLAPVVPCEDPVHVPNALMTSAKSLAKPVEPSWKHSPSLSPPPGNFEVPVKPDEEVQPKRRRHRGHRSRRGHRDGDKKRRRRRVSRSVSRPIHVDVSPPPRTPTMSRPATSSRVPHRGSDRPFTVFSSRGVPAVPPPVPGLLIGPEAECQQLVNHLCNEILKQDASFAVQNTLIQFIAGHLLRAGFSNWQNFKARIFRHEIWNYEVVPQAVKEVKKFCVLELFPFEPLPVHVGTFTVFWSHGTSTAGLAGILNDRSMKPTGNFFKEQPEPFSAFMCLATKLYRDEDSNHAEMARVLSKTWNLAKNRCNVMIVGHATGVCSTVDQGGAWETLLKAKHDLVVHDRREKRWAIHCNSGQILGLAFLENAQPQLF